MGGAVDERQNNYPLMEQEAGALRAASGRPAAAIGLATLGELSPADLRIGAETLRAQAAVAQGAGFTQLAENLTRAAELTAVPNDELLRMYEIMRPGRSTYDQLQEMATALESRYSAVTTAAMVREAAEVYRQRNLLKRSR
ncbi:MAG: glycerol dehydrogenase [Caldilinea sp. CFX5]|nr:glycerol dehydrogenase [Caldilinea sp. CFX5]